GTEPENGCRMKQPEVPVTPAKAPLPAPLRLLRPTPGLQLAMDSRIPDALEVFPLALPKHVPAVRIDWLVDGQVVGATARHTHQFLWPLVRGPHTRHPRPRPSSQS